MYIIVGSSALEGSNINFRKPKDVDIWADESAYEVFIKNKQPGEDIKLVPKAILELVEYDADTKKATPNSIYTIKCSHLGWNNPMWQKHKSDILTLKKQGCVLIPELYNALLEFWKTEINDKSFLSLNKVKDDFFDDNVPYVYDHDWLHEQVSYPNPPVYTYCLQEGADVMIDREKFNQLPYDQQIRMFREEVTTIAIERYIVNPNVKGRFTWVQAYNMSVHKTITQLTKGWATNFMVENLEHFITPDYSYFEHALRVVDK